MQAGNRTCPARAAVARDRWKRHPPFLWSGDSVSGRGLHIHSVECRCSTIPSVLTGVRQGHTTHCLFDDNESESMRRVRFSPKTHKHQSTCGTAEDEN
jgi:hypothetical protein